MLFNALVFLVPLMATSASAGCFGGGMEGDKGTANNALDEFVCKELSGYYVKGQQRNACVVKSGQTVSWHFNIKQEGNGGTIDFQTCKDKLAREVNDCGKGGRRSDGGWEYTSDPNDGICQDTEYINSHFNNVGKRDSASSEAQAGTRAARVAMMRRESSLHFEGDVMVVYGGAMPVRNEAGA